MHTCFWSVKGGVGVSTMAGLHALALAGRAEPTLLVDLAGDQPALLGVDEPTGPGALDWVADGARDPTALGRIAIRVTADLSLLPLGGHRGLRGSTEPDGLGVARQAEGSALAEALASHPGHVVVDCGLGGGELTRPVLRAAGQRLLVLRLCYLTLRKAREPEPGPTGVVLVREKGRALGSADVEAVTGVPILADIACDDSIARSIDAGLVASRMPRSLRRTLEGLAHGAV